LSSLDTSFFWRFFCLASFASMSAIDLRIDAV
jgi:hypothetical protein